MRIGINASFLRKPGTGIGQVTLHFLEQLRVSSYAQEHEFILYVEETAEGVSGLKQFQVRSFLPKLWRRDDLFRKWLWERQVATEALRDGCDAFLSLYQAATVFPQSSLRHTMVVHDLIPRLFPEYQGNWRQRFVWQRVEHAIGQANALIAVSQATADDLVEFGVSRERISIAYPDAAPIFRGPLSSGEEKRVLEKYQLAPGYIYHGGGMEVRKNTAGLMREYATLVQEEKDGGEDAVSVPLLVLSGRIFAESNTLATPVQSLVKELGLTDRVRLLDFVPEADLPVLYKNALFFVYPSFYEGFGLPVLEALIMRTPVLAADVSSLPEVAGAAALYIDPHLAGSLRSGMKRMIQDEALRIQLRQAAEHQVDRFHWADFTKNVILQVTGI